MNKSKELYQLGQSIWFDNVDRKIINNGWLGDQIRKGVIYGLTSNPSIFGKSIRESEAYSLDIQSMSLAGLDSKKIYEKLAIQDIQNVADLLKTVYQDTNYTDGYVSLEVDPTLANDTKGTVSEAKRLWNLIDRKNLLVKIPATHAGIFAIREAIANGINVNVTLIFSVDRYLEVIDAYMGGLEKRIASNLPIDQIHSIASVFVSRLDVKVESRISELINSGSIREEVFRPFEGKIAINNVLNIYQEFEKSIKSDRFKKISTLKGNIQRPLWASTGTKNSSYSDVLYVEGLSLPNTVNTVPPITLAAFLDHGTCKLVDYSSGKEEFQKIVNVLEKSGIDFQGIWSELEQEGVAAFSNAQADLINVIDKKRASFQKSLGSIGASVAKRIDKLASENFSDKFFKPVASIWTNDSKDEDEILHRMGWVNAPISSKKIIEKAKSLLEEINKDGFSHAVVLGMGGSSLAPEVFSRIFKEAKGGVKLSILDSTDPVQIDDKMKEIPVGKTLFIISSKSGTTAEVKALFSFFWDRVEQIDKNSPGDHFIAITDSGTQLEILGKDKRFRKVFIANADVGGRYSALITFGIIPAILAGVDGYALLDSADRMRTACSQLIPVYRNPGFILGSILAEANLAGRDKLTIIADPELAAFGSWLEQLVAESSGKDGKGIVPIDLEPQVPVSDYSNDRLFYYIRKSGEFDEFVESLLDKNQPAITFQLDELYDLGGEIYKWEIAIATACSIMGVNPFNQPNVQESKTIANEMIKAYKNDPVLDEGYNLYSDNLLSVFGLDSMKPEENTLKNIFTRFLKVNEKSFIGINAFLPRNTDYQNKLQQLRKILIKQFLIPVTLGFGPRFMHSTGQLHKGGKNNGIFLIITQDSPVDFQIPNEGMRFSTLEKAQALGDMKALVKNDRRVMRINLKSQLISLDALINKIEKK